MRRSLLTLLVGLTVTLSACDTPADPEERSTIGQWRAMGPGLTQVNMTLTETGRTITGAGSWVNVESALAFRVTGARVETAVSLLLDFDDAADINFRGEFLDGDTMDGELNGGPIVDVGIQFVRVPVRAR